MDWWTDFTDWLGGGGDASALDNIDYGGGWNPADYGEYASTDYLSGVSDNIDMGGGWNPADYGGDTPNEVYTNNAQDEADFFRSSQNTNPAETKGIWDKATDFLGDKKNDTMIKLGTSLGANVIGSYQKGKAEEKADKKLQELREYNDKVQKEKEDRADARAAANRSGGGGSSALETLAAKDAIDQANKAKYSASVSGLRPSGLINSKKKLTYVGGKPVYTDAGQLAN